MIRQYSLRPFFECISISDSLMEDFQAAGLQWKKPCPFKWRCCNCFQLVRPAEGLIKRGLCTLQVMRIDITSLNTADNSRTMIDSASVIKYSPCCVKQLLVTTTANKLLKFDSRTGRILAEVWWECVFVIYGQRVVQISDHCSLFG